MMSSKSRFAGGSGNEPAGRKCAHEKIYDLLTVGWCLAR